MKCVDRLSHARQVLGRVGVESKLQLIPHLYFGFKVLAIFFGELIPGLYNFLDQSRQPRIGGSEPD